LFSLFLAANTGWAAAPSVTSSPRPLPATSTQQVCLILLFCSFCAKRSTPNPNVRCCRIWPS
jgi:hypothetical protein